MFQNVILDEYKENLRRKSLYGLSAFILLILLIIFAILNGPVKLTYAEMYSVLSGQITSGTVYNI